MVRRGWRSILLNLGPSAGGSCEEWGSHRLVGTKVPGEEETLAQPSDQELSYECGGCI